MFLVPRRQKDMVRNCGAVHFWEHRVDKSRGRIRESRRQRRRKKERGVDRRTVRCSDGMISWEEHTDHYPVEICIKAGSSDTRTKAARTHY